MPAVELGEVLLSALGLGDVEPDVLALGVEDGLLLPEALGAESLTVGTSGTMSSRESGEVGLGLVGGACWPSVSPVLPSTTVVPTTAAITAPAPAAITPR